MLGAFFPSFLPSFLPAFLPSIHIQGWSRDGFLYSLTSLLHLSDVLSPPCRPSWAYLPCLTFPRVLGPTNPCPFFRISTSHIIKGYNWFYLVLRVLNLLCRQTFQYRCEVDGDQPPQRRTKILCTSILKPKTNY